MLGPILGIGAVIGLVVLVVLSGKKRSDWHKAGVFIADEHKKVRLD